MKMKKAILFILMSLVFASCVNEKKRHLERLNELIGTNFDYQDERITMNQEQDFSSLVTEISIPLTPIEKQQILSNNKHFFRYYETKVDSFVFKGFSYQFENERIRESINIEKDSMSLNYSIQEGGL